MHTKSEFERHMWHQFRFTHYFQKQIVNTFSSVIQSEYFFWGADLLLLPSVCAYASVKVGVGALFCNTIDMVFCSFCYLIITYEVCKVLLRVNTQASFYFESTLHFPKRYCSAYFICHSYGTLHPDKRSQIRVKKLDVYFLSVLKGQGKFI